MKYRKGFKNIHLKFKMRDKNYVFKYILGRMWCVLYIFQYFTFFKLCIENFLCIVNFSMTTARQLFSLAFNYRVFSSKKNIEFQLICIPKITRWMNSVSFRAVSSLNLHWLSFCSDSFWTYFNVAPHIPEAWS